MGITGILIYGAMDDMELDEVKSITMDYRIASLHAHRDKLGMKVVDEFEFNGQRLNTLVFGVGKSGA